LEVRKEVKDMEYLKELKDRLDMVINEAVQMKKIIIHQGLSDKKRAEEAWADLMLASEEISNQWEGPSALEEVRDQRGRY
jgi:hypothetical protein